MNSIPKVTTECPNEKGGNKTERLLNKRGNGAYKRILLGADFSPSSTLVFKHALQLAKQNNAELLILHAFDLPGTLSFMPPDCYEEWLKSNRSQTMARAKCLVDQARKEGVRCHAVIRQGAPENAIADAVTKAKIDLAVIGTHARRGLSRLMLGSTASRIIPRARCPVLTVRAAK
jgi:nucleotide-binding universal stress UspA family protein